MSSHRTLFIFPPNIFVFFVVILFATTSMAGKPDAQNRVFASVHSAKDELCELQATDFKIGIRSDSLLPQSQSSVTIYTSSQAAKFWATSNGNYKLYYKDRSTERELPADSALRLKEVIATHLCSPEAIEESLNSGIGIVQAQKVIGATVASCFVTIEQYSGLIKKILLGWFPKKGTIKPLSENTVDACQTYYEEQYFAPEFQRLQAQTNKLEAEAQLAAERKAAAQQIADAKAAEAAAARAAEQERREAEKVKQRQAQRDAEQLRERHQVELDNALDALAIEAERFVLGPITKSSRANGELIRNLNEVNQAAWTDLDARTNMLRDEFREPPPFRTVSLERGEFEKTSAYEARVASANQKARTEHEILLAYWKEEKLVADDELQKLTSNLNSSLLVPLRGELEGRLGHASVTEANYDADSEVFSISIAASNFSKFEVTASIPVSVNLAPNAKADLLDSQVWLVFQFRDFRLEPTGALLRGGSTGQLYRASVKNLSISAFSFDRKTLTVFEEQLSTEEAARVSKAKQDEQEREARIAAQRERDRKERESWPQGVIGTIASGSFLCVTPKSAMKALIVDRANNTYVPLPYDCSIVAEKSYIIEQRPVAGGLVTVRIYGAQRSGYTNAGSIGY